jgi:hypothetical protein
VYELSVRFGACRRFVNAQTMVRADKGIAETKYGYVETRRILKVVDR